MSIKEATTALQLLMTSDTKAPRTRISEQGDLEACPSLRQQANYTDFESPWSWAYYHQRQLCSGRTSIQAHSKENLEKPLLRFFESSQRNTPPLPPLPPSPARSNKSEHGDRVRRVPRRLLCHIPMLNDTRPIHTVNVRQRDRQMPLLVNPHMDETNVIVETVPQDCAWHEGDDVRQLPSIGIAALLVEGIVLDQVYGNVRVEGAKDVLVDVKGVDEAVEDLALDGFWCVARRAIRFRDVGTRDRVGVFVVTLREGSAVEPFEWRW